MTTLLAVAGRRCATKLLAVARSRCATKLLAVAGRRCATRRWMLLEVCCDDPNLPGATRLGIFRGLPSLAFAGGCYQTVVCCWCSNCCSYWKLLNGATKALCDQTLAVVGSLLRRPEFVGGYWAWHLPGATGLGIFPGATGLFDLFIWSVLV